MALQRRQVRLEDIGFVPRVAKLPRHDRLHRGLTVPRRPQQLVKER